MNNYFDTKVETPLDRLRDLRYTDSVRLEELKTSIEKLKRRYREDIQKMEDAVQSLETTIANWDKLIETVKEQGRES